MRTHRFIRSMAAASALALFLAASLGAKKEDPPPAKSIRVAIMPVVNGSAEVGAPKIMEDILHDRLKEIPAAQATFLQPTDTERLLEVHNASDKIFALNEKWSNYGTLDSTAVDGIDSLLTVDAILFVKIAEWENVRVNVIGHGESNTTVGFQFALFDLATKKRTWFKGPREQRFANEVDVSSGAVNYDETGYIQSRKVTDPPRYEDVASDLVRNAFKKFPRS
ncbi:MAG TPA: hypothetical protein VL857_07800 [Candidatus Eisenbacteria bacterium]|nr:hypothetical protein [Candidatus Eisenbacteria bacterium]